MLLKKILFIGLFFSVNISLADEASVNNQWCNYMNGISEYRTSYGTYVDCLTDNYAIETEVDYNWKEAIGQALHYAEATEKKPAILFIKRDRSLMVISLPHPTFTCEHLDETKFINSCCEMLWMCKLAPAISSTYKNSRLGFPVPQTNTSALAFIFAS